jgi:hypothetical protein
VPTSSRAHEPANRVILRCVIFYALTIGVGALVWRWLPHGGLVSPSMETIFGTGRDDAVAAAAAPIAPDDVSMALTVAVAMLAAALLAIPVAWVYLLTRAKRGYQQSVVQLLVMLPAVVAGIVLLVKSNLALAFSLAGIVAAVRFRNSLDDSKDAVYVFLATAIGLAAAVNLPAALVISVGFNVTVLMLWYTDFGSAPVELDGRIAEKRLARARELARTGTFVARMDEEVFRNMTREQLKGVADRAWKRASAITGEEPEPVVVPESRTLRLYTRNPGATRQAIEPRLEEFTKGWRFGSISAAPMSGSGSGSGSGGGNGTGGGDGATSVVEYVVQLKKRISSEELVSVLRTAGAPEVQDVELV